MEVQEIKQSQWQSLHIFYQKGALHSWAQNSSGAGRVMALAVNSRKHLKLMQCLLSVFSSTV